MCSSDLANRSGEEGAQAQPIPLTRRKRNRNTDSVHGHLGPGSRTPSGARAQRRVGERHGQPGRASRQPGTLRTFGIRVICRLRATGGTSPSGAPLVHARVRFRQRSCGEGAEGTGATPTGLSEIGSDWHQDRWHGQPGQRVAVPTGSRPGNRCRIRTRHRPPRRKARRAM